MARNKKVDEKPILWSRSSVIITAVLFGVLGVHDFMIDRILLGFLHIILLLVAYVMSFSLGNITPLVITIPLSWSLGIVEAIVYGDMDKGVRSARGMTGKDFRKMRKRCIILWVLGGLVALLSVMGIAGSVGKTSDQGLTIGITVFFFVPIAAVLCLSAIIYTIMYVMRKNKKGR